MKIKELEKEIGENLKEIDTYLKKSDDICWEVYDCNECCCIGLEGNCGSCIKDLIEKRRELLEKEKK